MATVSTSSSSSIDAIDDDASDRVGDGPSTPFRRGTRQEYFDDDGPMYEPIRTFTTEPQAELARLASVLSRVESRLEPDGRVERRDTLAGIEFGDPVLDPSKPEFDFYKWVRMFVKIMEEEGIKHHRAGFT